MPPTMWSVELVQEQISMSYIRTVNVNSITMSTSSLKVSDKMQGHKINQSINQHFMSLA